MSERLRALDGYVTGELPDGDALDALEAALFDAPDDPDLAFLDHLAGAAPVLVAEGTFGPSLTRAALAALVAADASVQLVAPAGPGTDTEVVVAPAATRVATRLGVPGAADARVDVDITLHEHGDATKTITDVIVDGGEVILVCSRPLALMVFGAGRGTATVRRRDAARTPLAAYHFHGPR